MLEATVNLGDGAEQSMSGRKARAARLTLKVLFVGIICHLSTEIGFAHKLPPHNISALWPTGAILFSVLVATPRPSRNEHVPGNDKPDQKPTARSRRLLWVLLGCLIVSGIGSFVLFKFVLSAGLPNELLGTWQIIEGNEKGPTVEIRWNGTAVTTMHDRGKKASIESTVRMEKDKPYLTTRNAVNSKDETVTQMILKLTHDEIVLRDHADKAVYRMIRIEN